MPELLAPGGSPEKLKYAFLYGADAVYVGMREFSLRTKATNFSLNDRDFLLQEKTRSGGKIYCALNIAIHQHQINLLKKKLEELEVLPFDAYIVSDMGAIQILRKHFPHKKIHLSTQANCLNSEAVKLYHDLGVTRIVLGRECSLRDIGKIKAAVPQIELEVFVHGAMCMAYSGRCYLSAEMTKRSANQGHCAHSCRWDYKMYVEEKERPGVYLPIEEGTEHTALFSARDLCMIDYLDQLRREGLDSFKIEGRMKSLYYVAVVTRAYRKALDHLEGKLPDENWREYRDELFKVSHREFSTGFYFEKEQGATSAFYQQSHDFIGTLEEEVSDNVYRLNLKNKIALEDSIEFIGPNHVYKEDRDFILLDSQEQNLSQGSHNQDVLIRPSVAVSSGDIVRKKKAF